MRNVNERPRTYHVDEQHTQFQRHVAVIEQRGQRPQLPAVELKRKRKESSLIAYWLMKGLQPERHAATETQAKRVLQQ